LLLFHLFGNRAERDEIAQGDEALQLLANYRPTQKR
jgi:hypothetical protein